MAFDYTGYLATRTTQVAPQLTVISTPSFNQALECI
jgi:hypothetical protein